MEAEPQASHSRDSANPPEAMPAEKISSLQNPRVKQLVKLRDRRPRDEAGVFLVEGYREIRRALEKRWRSPKSIFHPIGFWARTSPR
jgi:TrmH family RNA methyltransferase